MSDQISLCWVRSSKQVFATRLLLLCPPSWQPETATDLKGLERKSSRTLMVLHFGKTKTSSVKAVDRTNRPCNHHTYYHWLKGDPNGPCGSESDVFLRIFTNTCYFTIKSLTYKSLPASVLWWARVIQQPMKNTGLLKQRQGSASLWIH